MKTYEVEVMAVFTNFVNAASAEEAKQATTDMFLRFPFNIAFLSGPDVVSEHED